MTGPGQMHDGAGPRLLVIGTSHAGTLRMAEAAIAADWPDRRPQWYALPGGAFATARRDAEGMFGPDPDHPTGPRKAIEWNGRDRIDLRPYDRILLVGERFRLFYIAALLRDVDIWDHPSRGSARSLSLAFVTDAIRALVDLAADQVLTQFGPDARITVAPAPYPLLRAGERGWGHDRAIAGLRGLPAAAEIEALYEGVIAEALAARGYGCLFQPEDTRAGPFATADRFARPGPDTPPGAPPRRPDLRHMNAAFGHRVYAAWMQRLAAEPAPQGLSAAPHLP